MNAFLRVPLLILIGMIPGCALIESKETTYLQSAQDRATQQEVRQRLGAPTLAKAVQFEKSVWVYQFWMQQSGSRMSPAGTWCDEYVLTFDDHATLRRWTHQTHFHGGELMPTYCVSEGYGVKS